MAPMVAGAHAEHSAPAGNGRGHRRTQSDGARPLRLPVGGAGPLFAAAGAAGAAPLFPSSHMTADATAARPGHERPAGAVSGAVANDSKDLASASSTLASASTSYARPLDCWHAATTTVTLQAQAEALNSISAAQQRGRGHRRTASEGQRAAGLTLQLPGGAMRASDTRTTAGGSGRASDARTGPLASLRMSDASQATSVRTTALREGSRVHKEGGKAGVVLGGKEGGEEGGKEGAERAESPPPSARPFSRNNEDVHTATKRTKAILDDQKRFRDLCPKPPFDVNVTNESRIAQAGGIALYEAGTFSNLAERMRRLYKSATNRPLPDLVEVAPVNSRVRSKKNLLSLLDTTTKRGLLDKGRDGNFKAASTDGFTLESRLTIELRRARLVLHVPLGGGGSDSTIPFVELNLDQLLASYEEIRNGEVHAVLLLRDINISGAGLALQQATDASMGTTRGAPDGTHGRADMNASSSCHRAGYEPHAQSSAAIGLGGGTSASHTLAEGSHNADDMATRWVGAELGIGRKPKHNRRRSPPGGRGHKHVRLTPQEQIQQTGPGHRPQWQAINGLLHEQSATPRLGDVLTDVVGVGKSRRDNRNVNKPQPEEEVLKAKLDGIRVQHAQVLDRLTVSAMARDLHSIDKKVHAMQLTTVAHIAEAEQARRRALELRLADADFDVNPTPFIATWLMEPLKSDIGGQNTADGSRTDIKYGEHLAYLQTWMHEASCFSHHYEGLSAPKQVFDPLHPGSVDE